MRIPLYRLAASRLRWLILVLTIGLWSAAFAVEPFTVTDIRVEGLQRSDAGTVFAALPFRVGDTYNDEKGAAALRALFATGLFKDVRIDIEGRVVVVIVEERPIIANIDFVGMKEFEKDVLLKSLREVGLGTGLPFDKAIADRAEQEFKRQYLSRSLYGVEVVTTVTPIERNRVNLTFTVTEGETAHISEIRIVGNQAFSESTLRGLFDLGTTGWLSWYTKNDRYSRVKLNADLETLKAFYLNRGYLEFAIESTQVTISPDKQDIAVTINVREGQPYIVTEVRLEGNFLGREDEFKSLVTIQPGDLFRADRVAATTKNFLELYGAFGYAFARVDARPEIDRARGQVAVVLVGDPVRRVYVRYVNVSGNLRTRDEVIRREFRQFESSWYDARKIKLSRDRVDRLGYFSEVNIETSEVPGSPDQVDVTITVKEKQTGNISVGVGYSSANNLAFNAAIKQDNVLGTGNYLGLELNTSSSNRVIVLSTVDPYFTLDGISRAFDIYYRTTTPLNSQGEYYQIQTAGTSIRFGVPYSDFDTVYYGLGYEQTELNGDLLGMPLNYQIYIEQFGRDSNAFPLTLAWSRDQRDSTVTPNAGSLKRIAGEWSAGGDLRYLRLNLQYQLYIPITRQFTYGFNTEFGYGLGLNGREYPVFKNFFGGGLGSVRGFEQGSLGPIDVTGAFIGGTRRFNLNNELYVPVPGTGNDRTLRVFGYLDVGNVWGADEDITFDSLRASGGVGVSWLSPVGPLKLSYGVPIQQKPGDRIQKLQFQIGTAF
ncbi:MAG: outer membrane protein assembly factor BamA [Piscinibacter sp.]|nr:outer membrane protein assembly factor BamA [Piscinibacter sp.]